MRQKLLFIIAFLNSVSIASADKLIVENVTIPKGGQGTIVINYQFDEAELYSGWQFSLSLPTGLSTVKNDKGASQFTAGTCHDASYTISSTYSDGTDNYVAFSLESSPITGTTGMLLSIPLVANDEYEVGTVFNASLTDIQFGNKDGVHTSFFDKVDFTITIGNPADPRVTFDEAATTLPEAATGVDVRVRRTIKANEWSTICLPFAMTAEQCKAAFGDDVELGDFSGYETTEDGDAITGITVNFSDATAIEANHPYIIKVSQAVSEFTVDGVDIDPQEAEINKGTSRKPKAFIGNYVAGTEVENGCLFLNGGKFWYSVGATKIKAFRAYFNFFDLLTDFEDNYAEARIQMVFDGEATAIHAVDRTASTDDGYYNLAGQRVEQPGKGLYIKNNKKVIVK